MTPQINNNIGDNKSDILSINDWIEYNLNLISVKNFSVKIILRLLYSFNSVINNFCRITK